MTLAYTGETWSLLDGGVRTGERYLDNLDVQLTVDLEQLIGWQGAKAFVYGLYDNGTPFSSALVGDLQVFQILKPRSKRSASMKHGLIKPWPMATVHYVSASTI